MTEQEQVEALYACQATTDVERELADSHPARVEPYRDRASHVVDLYEVVLETGRLTYFKPVNAYQNAATPLKRALRNYSQTPVSALIAECAAWQLAKQLADPWAEMIAPTVLRSVRLPDGSRDVGSLSLFRPGEPGRRAYLQAVPEQAEAGAFFDVLIGQQDRNRGNVLWHTTRQQIHLIDHGFSFARPGDNTGTLELSLWRWLHGSRELTDGERAAAGGVVDANLHGLADYVEPDRTDALRERARRLRNDEEILQPGAL
ncbi:MAG: hypothetical protein ACRDK9_14575 [Solirubrobacterales bacterium]